MKYQIRQASAYLVVCGTIFWFAPGEDLMDDNSKGCTSKWLWNLEECPGKGMSMAYELEF